MMHLFLNGLAASAGGGLTYLRNVVPELSKRADIKTTLAVQPLLAKELGNRPNIFLVETETSGGAVRRFWREQTDLPQWIRRSGADVLISAGNFALWRSPVPQILLSRNSLYTSREFFADLRGRGEYGMWLDARLKAILAKRSIHWADSTVAPSQAFADELRRWTGRNVVMIHHGFDREAFFRDSTPLPSEIQRKLDATKSCLRLLFVSHYNYYRNFETLFRAMPVLQNELGGRSVKLFLTCELRSEENPGSYRAEGASALLERLGMSGNIVELGAVPYHMLHHVYRACDIYVTPAYTETFAHPLVEAMAAGLPVVASDSAVHREICGEAAVYFSRFSPDELATQVLRVVRSESLARGLSSRGGLRSLEFSWLRHVDQIVVLARNLAGSRANRPRTGESS
jgi:glycosyltransferase involved in cell wall biosynthesis